MFIYKVNGFPNMTTIFLLFNLGFFSGEIAFKIQFYTITLKMLRNGNQFVIICGFMLVSYIFVLLIYPKIDFS